MKALYRAAAQIVMLLHISFTLLALFGGFGLLVSPAWLWVHLPIVIWAVAVNLFGWICPLTPLEKRLWRAGGRGEYRGGFLIHYFGPMINFDGGSRRVEILTGVVVLIWNLVVYAGIWISLNRY